MRVRDVSPAILGALAFLAAAPAAPAAAQTRDIAKEFAPTGRLRVGVLMVSYFAIENSAGQLKGVIPDLAAELGRRLAVPVEIVKLADPGEVIGAFRKGELDVTFIGITVDRAAAFDFGPVLLDLQTSYLVPAGSAINSIDEIDRAGLRLLVPTRSAQEAYLKKIITQATLINVAVENPKPAVEKLAAGEADAFSHVVPMLASAQRMLPGSRILPGSYFNVPIAIGYAKGRSAAVADYATRFAQDVKQSGFVQQSLARAGESVNGVVVHQPR